MAATSDDTKNVNKSVFSAFRNVSSGLKRLFLSHLPKNSLLYWGSAVKIHAVDLATPF